MPDEIRAIAASSRVEICMRITATWSKSANILIATFLSFWNRIRPELYSVPSAPLQLGVVRLPLKSPQHISAVRDCVFNSGLFKANLHMWKSFVLAFPLFEYKQVEIPSNILSWSPTKKCLIHITNWCYIRCKI